MRMWFEFTLIRESGGVLGGVFVKKRLKTIKNRFVQLYQTLNEMRYFPQSHEFQSANFSIVTNAFPVTLNTCAEIHIHSFGKVLYLIEKKVFTSDW